MSLKRGLWKFNKSLIKNENYCEQMKKVIKNVLDNLDQKELFKALKSMPNDKSPGNDGLMKEFFGTFWSEVKKNFSLAFHTLLIKGNSAPHKDKQLLD